MADADAPYVEAIVVRCARPTIARAGDRAVIRPDGTIEGFIGGSCADETVRLQALRCLETGEALLLKIIPGAVDGPAEQEGEHPVRLREPSAREEGAVVVANPCLSGGALEVFLQPHVPAPRVAVIGDSPVAHAVARLAPLAGFAVTDAPGTADFACVVASLGHGDEDAVAGALATGAAYVGLVASRRRGAAVLDELRARGLDVARVHAPAGLDLHARTHDEIALSIVAELVAERRRPVVAPEPLVHHSADGAHCHS